MKGIIKKLQGKIAMSWRTLCRWETVLTAVVLTCTPMTVLASSTSYTKPLDNLEEILVNILEKGGVLIIAIAIPTFGYCWKNDNQNGELNAFKIGVAGLFLLAAGTIIDLIVA